MNRNSVYIITLLAVVWVVLHESVTVSIVLSGAAVSFSCVWMYIKSIVSGPKPDYSVVKLLAYPLLLLIQAYISGVSAIRLVFFSVKPELIEIKTGLSSPFLRAVLTNSITLTPVSIALDLKGDVITILWLRRKIDVPHTLCVQNANRLLKGGMEKMLMKAQNGRAI